MAVRSVRERDHGDDDGHDREREAESRQPDLKLAVLPGYGRLDRRRGDLERAAADAALDIALLEISDDLFG
jgi:hypothetical protein